MVTLGWMSLIFWQLFGAMPCLSIGQRVPSLLYFMLIPLTSVLPSFLCLQIKDSNLTHTFLHPELLSLIALIFHRDLTLHFPVLPSLCHPFRSEYENKNCLELLKFVTSREKDKFINHFLFWNERLIIKAVQRYQKANLIRFKKQASNNFLFRISRLYYEWQKATSS